MTTLATESFSGTNGAAWPAQWTTATTSGTGTATIQANAGQMTVGTGSSIERAYLASMASATDMDATVSALIPASGSGWLLLSVDSDNGLGFNSFFPTSGYSFQVAFDGAGGGTLNLYRCPTSGTGLLTDLALPMAAGSRYSLRLQRVGSVVRAKAWLSSASEPATWNLTYTDPSPIATPGKVSLAFASTTGARTTTWDDLVVTDGATPWVNRTLVQAPRNGTTSHTVSFTAATAGNLLVAVVGGGVTSTTPTGWTLPTGGSAVNSAGAYVWYKTATAGESSFSTTHNGSNYPIGVVVYEFPSGSSFVKAISDSTSGSGAANIPNLTGLTGTNSLFGVLVVDNPVADTQASATTWTSTVSGIAKDADLFLGPGGITDGYILSTAFVANSTATSFATTSSYANNVPAEGDRINFAVNVAAGTTTTTSAVAATAAATASLATAQTDPKALTATGAATSAVSGASPSAPVSATGAASASVGTSQTDPKALTATGAATVSLTAKLTDSNAVTATGAATATASGSTGGTPPTSALTATASATAGFTAVTPAPPTPPAPIPDPVFPVPPVRRMAVTIYDGSYNRVGQVPDYVSCSVDWQYLGVGAGTLVVGEDDPVGSFLLAANTNVVPVVVQIGDLRWSGRVATASLTREGPPGSGEITATLADDWIWAQRMLASQNGASSVLTSMPQYDTRTGPAASVAADYINAAATRLSAPVRASKPGTDLSPSISLQARMTVLSDLLSVPLNAAGVTMAASIWLPGDQQPNDLSTTLTTPTVVFSPKLLADKPWLQWTDSMINISKMTFQVSQPLAYRAIVGLTGTDAARVYDSYTDTVRQTATGTFGLPEIYSDASSVAFGTASQGAAIAALDPISGTASGSFEVADGSPWTFGTDYVVGDMASIVVNGAVWRQQITKVTATDDRTGGLVFTPVVGDQALAASGDEMMALAMARVARGLRTLQAGR